MFKCSLAIYRLRLFLFPPLLPLCFSLLPFILSPFSVLDLSEQMLLGVFLCWNSFAGCLRNSGALVFSNDTHTWGAASCGQASRFGRGWLALGGEHYSWHTAALLCVGAGGELEVLGHHPRRPRDLHLPARPLKMRAPLPPPPPPPPLNMSSPRGAGLCRPSLEALE